MSSTKRADRGFTLVEVLVSSVMAAMFFTMLYGMFLPVLSVSSASSSKVDTLSAATTALYQMEADIRVGTTDGISVGSSTATPVPTLGSSAEVTELAVEVPVKFANVNDDYGQSLYDSGTGLSDFETYVVYALVSETAGGQCDSTHPCDLWRTTWDSTVPATSAFPIEQKYPGQLATIVGSITTTGRLLARNITSFQVANQVISCGLNCTTAPRPEVDLELAAYSTDQQNKVSQTSYQTQVFVRNN
jgi:prepilin-type N-terminal cleavage/methylation domain-containing protein